MNKYLLAGIAFEAMSKEGTAIIVAVHCERSRLDDFNAMHTMLALREVTVKHTWNTIIFANGSRVVFMAHDPRAVRGLDADLLLIDESCMRICDGAPEFFVAAQPVIAPRKGRIEYI